MAAPQVVSVLPLPSRCLLVKMQGCPRLSDAALVCQPDRRYCVMRQYTGPAVSLGIGKMMLPLFLTPCFIDCRSLQSRSCPWFVSGVSSPRHADGILKRVHILFGRSFRFQGAWAGLSPVRTDAPEPVRPCRLAACRNVSQFEPHFSVPGQGFSPQPG